MTLQRLDGQLAWNSRDQRLGHSQMSEQQSWTVFSRPLAASEECHVAPVWCARVFWVVFSFCILFSVLLSSVLFFPTWTDVNGTAPLPHVLYSLTALMCSLWRKGVFDAFVSTLRGDRSPGNVAGLCFLLLSKTQKHTVGVLTDTDHRLRITTPTTNLSLD